MSEGQNIENLFKQRFDDFKPEVDSSLWQNISQQLPGPTPVSHGIHTGTKGLLKSISIKTIISAVTAVVVTTSAIIYFSTEKKSVNTTKPEQVIVEQQNVTSTPVNDLVSSSVDNKNEKSAEKTDLNSRSNPSGNKASSNSDPVKSSASNNGNPLTLENHSGNSTDKNQPVPTVSSSVPPLEKPLQKNTDNDKKDNASIVNSNTSGNKTTNENDASECNSLKKNIPTIFTPNGDGKNDLYVIKDAAEIMRSLKVGIYSSLNGKLIYEWDGLNGSWDGLMKDGSQAPSGGNYMCIYIFETKKGESCQGATPILINR